MKNGQNGRFRIMTALILYSINIAWHMYMHQAGEYQPPSQASQQDHHLSGSILALEVLYRDWVFVESDIICPNFSRKKKKNQRINQQRMQPPQ